MAAAPTNTTTGRSAFLALLKSEGITHLFGNPGTTELPIMHALAEHPELTYVMAMQESLVVAMADGFSRASGKLVAANVHVAPGLGNAMGSLYNAKFTGTPMILTAGQQEQGHGLMEALLYGPMLEMAAPLVKWAVEVTRLEDLPRIVRRAAKIATTPPTGPVFISLPGDILNMEGPLDLLAPSRIDSRVRPADDVLHALAKRLLKAERPIMIVGDEVVKSDAHAAVEKLALTLGCPVYQQSIAYGAHFRSRSPVFLGALTRQQATTRKLLEPYDLMIAVGTDPVRMSVYSEISPMPPGLPVVQIGLVDNDIAKNFPVERAVNADVRETALALAEYIARCGGPKQSETANARVAALAKKNWSTKRDATVIDIRTTKGETPINPDWLLLSLLEAMPKDTIIIDEALTSARMMTSLADYTDRYSFHGLASGGIGWGLPAAVGAALANPNRRVAAYVGDGSAMYSIQSLWTAAHHKLPITFVIPNNGGYRIIKQRLTQFHGSRRYVGMDFAEPSVDYVGLARAMGMTAERVSDPAALPQSLSRAFATAGPTLIEVMVDARV
jgi:benzoylformate decarboxylase